MPYRSPDRVPRAVYRLQLNRDFTLVDATAIAPYLHELGIDTVYLSPVLLSTPGSSHGYDVNDYRRIDPEIGGPAAFSALSRALSDLGMGVLLDFVPNHMGIEGSFNAWWREVLEAGRASPHARFFDISWTAHGDDRLHLPLLEDHYGRVLEAGKLEIVYREGEFDVEYRSHRFPLRLGSYREILRTLVADGVVSESSRALLVSWRAETASLESAPVTARRRQAAARAERRLALKARLGEIVNGDPAVAAALERRLADLNGDPARPRSYDALDRLLGKQHYRLARWQTGAYDTNYRRFFAVDSLVGLRMENAEVFADSHALVRQLIRDGHVSGLRIDHVDGLWDPEEYLDRLQQLARDARQSDDSLFVVVEKILAPEETLPESWPAHGTTGYEFIRALSGLFVDAGAEERFSRLYADTTGVKVGFPAVTHASKRLILEEVLANTTDALASALTDLVQADRRWRDLARAEIRSAVRETMACLRVYRTYRRLSSQTRDADRREIEDASRAAIRQNPLVPVEPFEFVRDVLVGTYPPASSPAAYREAVGRWALTLQQHTGAVMAKSVEDTAFYSFNRFIGLNEVGGDPSRFGGAAETFHRHNAAVAATTPHTLLATSTHDTKFSEDARARLYVLSEMGDDWQAWVHEWMDRHRSIKTLIDGVAAPDANEEYRLYQVLIAIWPLAPDEPDDDLRQRVRAHVQKITNEARAHSSWQQPSPAWIGAVEQFVDSLLNDASSDGFLDTMRLRAARVAEWGMINSLAQVVLKLTSPGVPDIYRGAELWHFAVVDPDNRRPVSWEHARAMTARARESSMSELFRRWHDGAIKLRITRDLLQLRARQPALFATGDYRPLPVHGRAAGHAVAFERRRGPRRVAVVVPRLGVRLGFPPIGAVWQDTKIGFDVAAGPMRDVLTGRSVPAGETLVGDLLGTLPFAVLES